MKALIRWGKFNLVGAMGMVVQLVALAVFHRVGAGHYLYASAAAVELAVLHNFVWHVHYTWRDRRDESPVGLQLLRFQMSNGMVSLVGNLVVMRVLVQAVGMPVVVSNAFAIVCCSVFNFCLGDRWPFAVERKASLSKTNVASSEARRSRWYG